MTTKSLSALLGGGGGAVGGVITLPDSWPLLLRAAKSEHLRSGSVIPFDAARHDGIDDKAGWLAQRGELLPGLLTGAGGTAPAFPMFDGTGLTLVWKSSATVIQRARSTDGGANYGAVATAASGSALGDNLWGIGGSGFSIFAAVDGGYFTVYTSADGLTFTSRAASDVNPRNLVFNGSRWLFTATSLTHYIAAANPHGTWTSAAHTNGPGSADYLSGGNGLFFAATTTTLKSSTDGLTWTTRTLPSGVGSGATDYRVGRSFVWTGQSFLGVALENTVGSGRSDGFRVMRSADGAAWALDAAAHPHRLVGASTVNLVSDGAGCVILEDELRQTLVSFDHGATWSELRIPFVPAGVHASAAGSTRYGSITFHGGYFWCAVTSIATNRITVCRFTAAQLQAAVPSYVGAARALYAPTSNAAYVRTQ